MLVSSVVHALTEKPNSKREFPCAYYDPCLLHRSGVLEDHTSSYFSHNNVEATKLREQIAEDSLEMLIQWLKKGGNVAIHGVFSRPT
jgi:hypothetical protein